MRRTGVIVAVLAAFLLVAAAESPAAENPTLIAVVGPGYSISLTRPGGAIVTNLDPGTYTIQVDDRADDHNFVLSGPGVDRATGVEFVGKQTWTVTLRDGSYDYVCAPHSYDMAGGFTVGTGGTTTTTPPTTTPKPAPKPVRVTAVVGPRRTIALRSARGHRVKTLKRGVVTFVVRDRSRTLNFRLRGPGINRATTLKYVGTTRWRLRLRAGVYRFTSDRGRLRGSFRVS